MKTKTHGQKETKKTRRQALLLDCEQRIAVCDRPFAERSLASEQIKDQELHCARGHLDWAEYCRERWRLSRSRAYQLLASARVLQVMSTMVDCPLPTNERQLRAIENLAPELIRRVWKKAVDLVGGHPTHVHVEHAKMIVLGEQACQSHAVHTKSSNPKADAAPTRATSLKPVSNRVATSFGLSERDRQILDLWAHGYDNKGVAEGLSIGYNTVRQHGKYIYGRLKVHSRFEAVAVWRALSQGRQQRLGLASQLSP